jgi:predicted nucleic acid-binding protein
LRVAVDSSVLVGLINPRDLWRDRALALRDALLTAGAELLYFDCVVTESISAAVRRLHEKGRSAEVEPLLRACPKITSYFYPGFPSKNYEVDNGRPLRRLNSQIPRGTITWIFPDAPNLYSEVLDLICSSSGALNFNDALIALACRQRGIPTIASFDTDFDHIPWLRRLAQPGDVIP